MVKITFDLDFDSLYKLTAITYYIVMIFTITIVR